MIVAKTLEGNPRFTANFQGWNLDAGLPDSLFVFEPTDRAEEIEMVGVSGGASKPGSTSAFHHRRR